MWNRICVLFLAFVTALPALADEDDWDNVPESSAPAAEAPAQISEPAAPAPVAESTPAATEAAPVATEPAPVAKPAEKPADPFAKLDSAKAPVDTVAKPAVGREVPVRYWIMGDSVEQEAIFVKIESDTVYLKRPNADEQKNLEKLQEATIAAMEESNGQHQDDEEDDEADSVATPAPAAPVAVADTTPAEQPQEQPQEEVDDGADDDFETALQKEDTRMKLEEIARVEEEIRQQEIQDSIAADSANPFIKIYRLDLRRLYNMEDDEMIDLGLSNYVVPEYVDDEEDLELYPPGSANLFVTSVPAACSLFVNGIPIKQVAPDTIKRIAPGKYTISVMQMLKGVEWWGTAVVRINSDSLNRIEIPVERPSTRLTLNTDPEAVEVFINEVPTVNIMPHYMTDVVVDGIRPQAKTSLYFRKVGYRDTTIVTEIKAFMPNLINVEMEPILDDLALIEEQNAFNDERSKRRIGRGLLWSSIVPIIAGGVMWYLAEKDWSDAADKKKAYGMSAFESPDTQKMVKDNHDLNKKGDTKAGIGIGLGVVGVGLLVAGFVLAF
ncbi:MAG: hypothetical protein IKJ76_08090 [Fibrobacter sp.]|nr:hypothetical protein [Fibrobacter sp.]